MFGTAAKRRIKRSDMNSIATQYLGLELSGPVIMGSSGLTSTLRHIVEAEEAGAGAVVLKSVSKSRFCTRLPGWTVTAIIRKPATTCAGTCRSMRSRSISI